MKFILEFISNQLIDSAIIQKHSPWNRNNCCALKSVKRNVLYISIDAFLRAILKQSNCSKYVLITFFHVSVWMVWYTDTALLLWFSPLFCFKLVFGSTAIADCPNYVSGQTTLISSSNRNVTKMESFSGNFICRSDYKKHEGEEKIWRSRWTMKGKESVRVTQASYCGEPNQSHQSRHTRRPINSTSRWPLYMNGVSLWRYFELFTKQLLMTRTEICLFRRIRKLISANLFQLLACSTWFSPRQEDLFHR